MALTLGTLDTRALEYEKPWRLPPVLIFDSVDKTGLRVLEHSSTGIDIYREPDRDSAGLRLRIDDSRRHWRIDAPEASVSVARAVARCLKYLVGCLLGKRGVLVLHASSVFGGSRNLIFYGPKGAGKSSFMYKACVEMGARFISDDLTVLWRDVTGRMRLSGWPQRVGVTLSAMAVPPAGSAAITLRRPQELPGDWQEFVGRSLPPEQRKRLMMDHDEFLDYFGVKSGHRLNEEAPTTLVRLAFDPDPSANFQISKGHVLVPAELSAEAKSLKFFTDYLRLAPDPLGPYVGQVGWSRVQELPSVKVSYGVRGLAAFGRHWQSLEP